MDSTALEHYRGKASPQDIHQYQRKVGSLLYAIIITYPDTSQAARKLSEFLTNPSPVHQDAVDQALSYLYSTRFYAIEYSARTVDTRMFIAASDATFADNLSTCQSIEEYLFKLFGGPID